MGRESLSFGSSYFSLLFLPSAVAEPFLSVILHPSDVAAVSEVTIFKGYKNISLNIACLFKTREAVVLCSLRHQLSPQPLGLLQEETQLQNSHAPLELSAMLRGGGKGVPVTIHVLCFVSTWQSGVV